MIELNWKTLRFIVVGVLGAIVYFTCSYLFLTLTSLPAFLASLLAYACSFGFAYLGQKYWAFRSIAPHSVTLFRYAVLQACCAIFAATFTQVSVSYSELSPLLLSALATVFTSGISYVVSSCWVFADTAEESSLETPVYQEPPVLRQNHWRIVALVGVWLILSAGFIYLYYYMPWNMNLLAMHDDALFVNHAKSLAAGDWLGAYSQYTLMKGPGYPLFLALTHIVGAPLYLLTAIFHCLTVSFFAWTLFRLSQSKVLSMLLFIVLLLLPLVISIGRIVRDEIYPDQFLLGFSALIFSLFIADTLVKRSATAMLAGLMFAWLWLTREEGVWVVPSVALLVLFALWQWWRHQRLKQGLLSSVLVMIVAFCSVQGVFQLLNWQAYERFVGIDIKEPNFKTAVAALQSVRVGQQISHVPVTQETMQHIYRVSPAFAELEHYFSHPTRWKEVGCSIYPWTCDEIAGGWFIWALRGGAGLNGNYQSPAKAANFFARVSSEINQACEDGRLSCQKGFLSFMPEIAQRDIGRIPVTLNKMLDVLLLNQFSADNMRFKSVIKGNYSSQRAIIAFLHSEDRFQLTAGKGVEVFGRYAVVSKHPENFAIVITDKQGKVYPQMLNKLASSPDENGFTPFSIATPCSAECRFIINIDDQEKINMPIPDVDQVFKKQPPISIGNLQIVFTQVVNEGRSLAAVVGVGERTTYTVRQTLFRGFQQVLPVLLSLGLIAFAVLTVMMIKQRTCSVLFVLSSAIWGAVLARLTILFLVHISSFPALEGLYFMPVYSLVVIASVISLYLLMSSHAEHGN